VGKGDLIHTVPSYACTTALSSRRGTPPREPMPMLTECPLDGILGKVWYLGVGNGDSFLTCAQSFVRADPRMMRARRRLSAERGSRGFRACT